MAGCRVPSAAIVILLLVACGSDRNGGRGAGKDDAGAHPATASTGGTSATAGGAANPGGTSAGGAMPGGGGASSAGGSSGRAGAGGTGQPEDAGIGGTAGSGGGGVADASTEPPGWIVLDDLEGTWFSPSLFGHIIAASVELPTNARTPSYTDADYSGAPLALRGCKKEYFSGPDKRVPADLMAGEVTFGGLSLDVVAIDANENYTSPLSPLVCEPAGNSFGNYTCVFGYRAPWIFPNEILLATLPRSTLLSECSACRCDLEGDAAPQFCEQHPLGLPGNEITATIAAASPYPGASTLLPLPSKLRILSASGKPPGRPADPLPSFDVAHTVDQIDQTITWSCDGSNTPGAGCPDDPDDVVSLRVESSSSLPDPFVRTDPFYRTTCFERSSKGSLTMSWRAFGLPGPDDIWARAEIAHRKLSTTRFGARTLTFAVGNGYFAIERR